MLIKIKIPELIKPHLVEELQEFILKEGKKWGVKQNEIVIKTHSSSKVKVEFVNAYNRPLNWKEFLDRINSILELDKH